MEDNQARCGMDRREFLRYAGVVLAAVAVVASGCSAPQTTAVLESQQAPVTQEAQPTSVAQQAQPTSVSAPAATTSGVACPAGILNDPYPGHCRRYVDNNGNGYCDLSEPGSGNNTPRVQG